MEVEEAVVSSGADLSVVLESMVEIQQHLLQVEVNTSLDFLGDCFLIGVVVGVALAFMIAKFWGL